MRVFTRLTLQITVFIIVISTAGCMFISRSKFIPTDPDAELRPRSKTKPEWAVSNEIVGLYDVGYRPYKEVGEIEVTVSMGSDDYGSGDDGFERVKEKMLDIAWDKGCDAIISYGVETTCTPGFTSYDAIYDTTTTYDDSYEIKYTGTAVIWE
ncbi:MAG: hypothetical protein GY771_07620 [bacterium]|nr:hypothetical protein [bacterium]